MSISPRRPEELSGRIFRAADAVAAGLLTRDDLRGPGWRRMFRGVYADAALADSHRQRCLAAAWYLLPATAAIGGRSAALMYGVRLMPDDAPVEVVAPWSARFGPVNGLAIHVGDLPDADIQERDGIRLTTPTRTAWDLTRWLDLPEAVAYLDVMAARSLIRLDALERHAREHVGRRGWRTLLRAVSMADPAAESVQESRLRVRLILAGLPKPVSQYVIERDGRFMGRVDLAWPRERVAVEYDGQWHAEGAQFHADRARLNRLVTTDGWIILHATSKRLRDDFDGLVNEVRSALRARSGRRTR